MRKSATKVKKIKSGCEKSKEGVKAKKFAQLETKAAKQVRFEAPAPLGDLLTALNELQKKHFSLLLVDIHLGLSLTVRDPEQIPGCL